MLSNLNLNPQLTWLKEHGGKVAVAAVATIAAASAAYKLKQLSNEMHTNNLMTEEKQAHNQMQSTPGSSSSSSSSSSPSALPPLPSPLFPSFIRSYSVPSLWLHFRCWEVEKPRCVIFILHGYGEHIGRYEGVAAAFNKLGASAYGLDHQGHGQSHGDRAHVRQFKDYVDDACAFISYIEKHRLARDKPLPAFLYGHSMGGLMAAQVMRATTPAGQMGSVDEGVTVAPPSTRDWSNDVWAWSGCILSSPALMAHPRDAKPGLIVIGRFLSRVLPKLELTRLPAEGISRDPAVARQYWADPLVWRGRMRARWGWEMLRTMQEVQTAASTLTHPMLIIQGGNDTLIHAPGATMLCDRATSVKDKTLHVFKDGAHEPHHDINRDEALRTITEWINERLPKGRK